jgi:predicted membrane chloride channel (bestrophin family)
MKVISAITTFFEVFYTNQTFTRYLHLYSTTRKLLGLISEFCFEATLHIKSSAQQHARLGARFFLCGVVLFFLELKNDKSEEEWENLKAQGLIKEDELAYLEETFHKQQRSLVMLHWAAKVIREGHKIAVENKKAPANALKTMVDKLVGARTCMQEVVDTLCLPIPFQYFHLLNVMIVVNLVLWAYGMGVTDSCFAPIVYFFAALIFMGMMELASQLSDPFGDDDTDFPITKWIADTMEDAAVILEYEYYESGWDPILKTEEPMRKSDAMRLQLQ